VRAYLLSRVIKHKSNLLIISESIDISVINKEISRKAKDYVRHTHFQLEIDLPILSDLNDFDELKSNWIMHGWRADLNTDFGTQKFILRSSIDSIPY
jgi:hypothetical protein